MTAYNNKISFLVKFAMIFFVLGIPLFAQAKERSVQEVTLEKQGAVSPSKPLLKVTRSSDSQLPKSSLESLSDEPESDRVFRRDLIVQINEIIKKVQVEYPVLSRKLDPEKQKEVLKSLVATLNSGMRYVSVDDPAEKESSVLEVNAEPGIMLASNKILYIRVDSFSKESLAQLKKDCESCAEFEKQSIGVIIDLRSSQGYDYDAAIHAAALFLSPEEMKKHNLKSPLKQKLTQPVIILTGSKTKGASEIFTKLLFETKRAISLGEPTAGVPFKKRKVALTNGDWLLIPQVPDNLAEILPESIKSSIKFTPYPQIKYDLLKKTPDAEAGDRCIQRAVELMICLDALKHE